LYAGLQGLDFQQAFNDYFLRQLGEVAGRLVLEYGCGNYGDLSCALARAGAKVVAGDISGESVQSTYQVAARHGLLGAVRPLKMDCEVLPFGDGVFDLVVGRAILHHLRLEAGLAEIRRVLVPGGRAVFIEPLGMNPLLNLYRRLTPGQRTPDEHPLRAADFRLFERYFARVEHAEFNFLPLGLLFLGRFFKNKSRLNRWLLRLQAADRLLFARFPYLARFSWTTVVTLYAG